jgi:hypothetical protein
MNGKTLALRDPAMAALMGAIAGDSFGAEPDDFGSEEDYGQGSGVGEFGYEFGYQPRFGQDAAMMIPAAGGGGAPPPAASAALWASAAQAHQRTQSRQQLLEPNSGSSVKVERYAFYLNDTIAALGTTQAIDATNQPDTNIRPQRVVMNAPAVGFITIDNLKVANVSVLVGGTADAFEYNANGVGQHLDMPTLSPANRATATGAYTGTTPAPLTGTGAYLFVVGLKGPASITA